MRRTRMGRTCTGCGRPLEIGEICNCRQPIQGATRDGLRARCPHFQHRSSYRGCNYIVCGDKKTPHPSRDERNEHYRRFCCGLYGLCGQYKTMKGEQDTCKTRK